MDSNMQCRSPDNSDGKPSFRKPSNDAGSRKYRRHSPVNERVSSPSGSPKHDRENYAKLSDDLSKRKEDGRESHSHVNSGHSRSDRGDDSYKNSERQSHGRSQNYPRDDEYSGYHKIADEGKGYKRSSLSVRESKSGTSEYTRRENKSDRSRGYWGHADKYARDEPGEFHRNKDKERDLSVLERHKYKEKYSSIDRATTDKTLERDRHNRDRGGRDDTRDSLRSLGEYKNDHISASNFRGEGKDLTKGKDSGGDRLKESYRMDGKNAEALERHKHDEGDFDRLKGRYNKETDEDNNPSVNKSNSDSRASFVKDREPVPKSASVVDESLITKSKQPQSAFDNILVKPAQSSSNEAEIAAGLNAAKIAAMRAAEMVNRNLTGAGYMSTDQKKKLLWGNKKTTTTEESAHRWDIPLFPDRERQEKFNKLMGVKGEVKAPEQNNPKDELQAEKQKELQMDLEKQYTAGLRRRDGRTVGLGL